MLLVFGLLAYAGVFGLLARNLPIEFSGNVCDNFVIWTVDRKLLSATSELNWFGLQKGREKSHNSIFL